ncbi:MAG: hypothetical protein ACKVOI_11295 [Dongiaceae bacterium]
MDNASDTQTPPNPLRPQTGAMRRPRRKARSCLKCRQSFMGSGPGERICLACKETDNWSNAVAATKGFIEW